MAYPMAESLSRRPSMHSSYTPFPYDGQLPRSRRPSFSAGYAYDDQAIDYQPAYGGAYSQGYATPYHHGDQYMPGTGYDDMALDSHHYPEVGIPGEAYSDGYYTPGGRRRRSSSAASHYSRATTPFADSYHRFGNRTIKFKRKGSLRTGITLGEAVGNIRLSGNDSYTFYDLNTDQRGRIYLKVRWQGYPSMTYQVPCQGYDGRIDLQTLARRVGRACTHFLQTNALPIHFDCVILHHLEEISIGTWQPVFSVTRP